jgi:thiamine biosynthesis lipoprotein
VDGLPFTFSIFNPITGTEDTSVSVADAALATSGTYKRHWKRGGKDVHHVLAKDGRGNPGTGVVSASVIHEDGGKAEAYAKVLLSLGPVDAKPFLEAARARYLAIMEDGTAIRKNI